METGRRIILTNETPNDQGGIIRNQSIDWSRFSSNPVMLYHHGKDPKVRDVPIGHWEDLMFDGMNYSAIPAFSETCPWEIKKLYEEGNLKASSIGGICMKKTTGKTVFNNETKQREPEIKLTPEGYWESEYFLVYEASITPIGSNMDALQLSAFMYQPEEILTEEEIFTLNSKYNMKKEEPKATEGKTPEVPAQEPEKVEMAAKPEEQEPKEEKAADAEAQPAPVAEPKVSHVILDSDKKVGLAEKFLTAFTSIFGLEKTNLEAPNPFHEEPDGDEPIKTSPGLPKTELPEGVQAESELEAKKADKKEEKADEEAEKKKMENEACNNEAELSAELEACKTESELEAVVAKFGSELPPVISKLINAKKENFKLSSKLPQMKTPEELAAEKLQLAGKPKVQVGDANVPSYTELRSTEDGRKVIDRVMGAGGKSVQIEDHRVVLQSILNDPKMKCNKTAEGKTLLDLITFSDKTGNRMIPKASVKELSARFESGAVDFMNFRSGRVQNYTELDATDDLLASPDLIAVEWLNIFLYKLFPSAAWKSEIPVFAASSTGKNKGLIYTNINADPAVYQGSRPSNPSNYEYDDVAVALTLSSFYLQPMLWQPLLMAMLRYDQQSTGWAQAMMKFNTVIDNYLIYSLLSQINAVATPTVVKTKGAAFTIAASTDPDAFVLNSAFTGALAKPTLNDLLVIDQVFKKQNYPEGTKFVVVQDPTMDRYITGDPETKSLLTRFVNSEGDELVSYKHAKLRTRSQVGLFNPATSGIVDPTGVVPSTAVSAGLAIVPDQVGIGIANLDVFMIQDPSAYGYKMSADIRSGAALMRKNGYGTAVYTYGEPQA